MSVIFIVVNIVLSLVALLLTSFIAYMYAMESKSWIGRTVIYVLYWFIVVPNAIISGLDGVGLTSLGWLVAILSTIEYSIIAFAVLLVVMYVRRKIESA